ncbi:hypothetical protein PC116_g4714 [Phytophthora cactorum]|nr:hypothetical protein PC116_g4714 [Phytophthora cactorum]
MPTSMSKPTSLLSTSSPAPPITTTSDIALSIAGSNACLTFCTGRARNTSGCASSTSSLRTTPGDSYMTSSVIVARADVVPILTAVPNDAYTTGNSH